MKKSTQYLLIKSLLLTLWILVFNKSVFSQSFQKNCICVDEVYSTRGFLPLLEDLNCSGIEKSLFELKYQKLKGLFYSDEETSVNACSFDLISYKKIELVMPNTNGLKIILNPCIKKASKIHFSIDYDHELVKRFPNANYKSFSKNPKDYYYMLVQMSDYNDKKYYNFLKQTKNIISGKDAPSEKFMADVRKLLPASKDLQRNFTGEQDFIEAFAQAIGSCASCVKKHPVEWVWEVLLKKELNPMDSMEITKGIVRDFTFLFESTLGPFNLENFNKMIYPQVTTTVLLNKSSIMFPSTILRKWDINNRKANVNDSSAFIASEMLFNLEKIISKDNNQNILLVGFKNPCMEYSEISGTEIIIQPDSSNNIFSANKDIGLINQNKELLDPELINFLSDSIEKKLHGFLLSSVNVLFPINTGDKVNHITAKGLTFIINGKTISGIIKIQVSKKDKNVYEIKSGREIISFKISDLYNSLNITNKLQYKINISDINNKKSEAHKTQTITIYFNFKS